jgi:diguanylate cyclase (GGDEF)-like protein
VTNRRWLAAAAVVAAVTATLVVVMLSSPAAVTVPVDDYAEMVAPMIAAGVCWWTAARHHGRARVGWILIGASAATWGAGQAAWTWQELVLHLDNPFPSPSDAGFLTSVPLLLLGLFTLPVWPAGSGAKLRAIGDGLLTAGGLVVISWHTLLAAIVASPADSALAQGLSLAYPICDAIVVTVLVIMWTRTTAVSRAPIVMLGLGLGLIAISDSTFAYLQAQGSFGSGSVVDLGWVAGYLVVALAALYALDRPFVRSRARPPRWRSAALPYLPLPAAIVFALQEHFSAGGISLFTLFTGLALFSLVLLRQALSVQENIGLLRRLAANEVELNHRAEHDALTDLANRATFIGRVDGWLADSSMSSLSAMMFVDLDDFKQVNDSLGHTVGDEAIIDVGRRLQSCMRDGDLVGRLGGDEFAIFLTRLPDVGHLVRIAERLIEALNEPFHSSDMRASVCGTIGIAIAEPGDNAGELLRRADLAMYAAKARGKGLFGIFEPSMHVAMYAPLERRAALVNAVQAGEFVLYFQPVVDVATRGLVGMEALLRWSHPTLGVLPPADFIADLESSGLMVEVGTWVVNEACRQAVRVRRATGRDLFVSVNVSSSQLHDGGFVGVVDAAVAASGLPLAALIIELTESGSVGESELVALQLRQLREKGVRVAIDDFGSGYSSFAYLRRLRVDILKIEKAFVDDLLACRPTSALVESMVTLGANLGLVTIAEGVEEAAQHDALAGLGCHLAQGYLHARPMPVEMLLVEAARWQTDDQGGDDGQVSTAIA